MCPRIGTKRPEQPAKSINLANPMVRTLSIPR